MQAILDEAIVHLFLGFGLALLNTVIRYFAPHFPQIISVLKWQRLKTAFIAAYMIALIFQLVTSPLFATLINPAYRELAWSPFQALFNVLGVVVMDLILMGYRGTRRGIEVSGKQFDSLRDRVSEEVGEFSDRVKSEAAEIGERVGTVTHGHENRRKQEQEVEARAAQERQQRLNDNLKDY